MIKNRNFAFYLWSKNLITLSWKRRCWEWYLDGTRKIRNIKYYVFDKLYALLLFLSREATRNVHLFVHNKRISQILFKIRGWNFLWRFSLPMSIQVYNSFGPLIFHSIKKDMYVCTLTMYMFIFIKSFFSFFRKLCNVCTHIACAFEFKQLRYYQRHSSLFLLLPYITIT